MFFYPLFYCPSKVFDFRRAQLSALPYRKLAYREIAKARTAKLQHRVSYGFKHAAYLTVLALMDYYLSDCGIAVMLCQMHLGRRSDKASDVYASFKAFYLIAGHYALGADKLLLVELL